MRVIIIIAKLFRKDILLGFFVVKLLTSLRFLGARAFLSPARQGDKVRRMTLKVVPRVKRL